MKYIDEILGCMSKGIALLLGILCGIGSVVYMIAACITTMVGLPITTTVFSVAWILNGLLSVYFIVRLNDGYYD